MLPDAFEAASRRRGGCFEFPADQHVELTEELVEPEAVKETGPGPTSEDCRGLPPP